MIHEAVSWSEVPSHPAVYAMHGGEPPRTWAAYVGLAGDLESRLTQHFVRRDSSVVTQSSAVGVNIDLVVHVEWWEHPRFTETHFLHAAELVAFDVIKPALISRGNIRRPARQLANDRAFRRDMESLFKGQPHGRYRPPRVADLARELRELQRRVAELENRLGADDR